MNDNKNWYVVYTKPKCEKRIAEIMEKKHIPTYLPESSKVQYLFGRKRVVKLLVMPLHLFVFCNEQDFKTILEIDGVSGLLYYLRKPAVIKSKEISDMQRFLIEHNDIFIQKIPVGCEGGADIENIINSNPFFAKNYYEVEKVYLPSLGYCLGAVSTNVLLNKVA